MRSAKSFIFAILGSLPLAVFLWMMTERVEAIPAFARKYQTSCQTCHVAYPKLNAFGEAFRNNGYRFPRGDSDTIEDKPVPLGAPGWKRVWPKGVWPSDIPNLPPVALNVTNTLAIRFARTSKCPTTA